MKRKASFFIVAVLFATLAFGIAPAGAYAQHRYACAELTNASIPHTEITVAQQNPVSDTLPAHCEIVGAINQRTGVDGKPYAIRFHLRMPDDWNKRFYFQGGGGMDGNLGDATGSGALSKGYAVVSTDAGHDNTINFDANAGGTTAFGIDPQARIDQGYNAVGMVTLRAKEVIKLHYGKKPRYSYFVGCSNGGRQGMVASQRFPDQFDGIVAGDPGFNVSAPIAAMWNEQVIARLATQQSVNGQPYLPDTFSDNDLALAGNAILAACDELDGLEDGIIDNYTACTDDLVFREFTAIQCDPGPKTASCLSAAQIDALKTVYAGPKNSQGKALYSDWPWDPGIGFRISVLGTPSAPGDPLVNNALNILIFGAAMPMIFTSPPEITPLAGVEKYVFNYDFDVDAPKVFQTGGIYTESAAQFNGASSTDLSAFKRGGGKMILYHGQSDNCVSSRDTTKWYNKMDERMRGKARDFARLFLVPGMQHCASGPGTTQFNAFDALVNWVEHNTAPDSIIGTAPAGTPWPGRTRPLCPYPEQTRYTGFGDINDADNFVCVMPR